MNAAPDLVSVPELRPADLADVEAMSAMINRFAAQGLMLPKSRNELARSFREYVVFMGKGGAVACAGLRVYSPELAEIVGLAVHEDWQGRGLGPRLVEHVVEEARGLGIKRLFAMALHEGLFHTLGFRTIPRDWLPEKVAADCRTCARRVGCREVAVITDLDPAAAPLGPPTRRKGRRKLTLVPITVATQCR
ncbi:MAG: GNAT family N-acetyltransferase [Gemmatimonadetes bacterium]|nr:GNAT family N-acetyltransferase [Gemmatimonadota bacterium]